MYNRSDYIVGRYHTPYGEAGKICLGFKHNPHLDYNAIGVKVGLAGMLTIDFQAQTAPAGCAPNHDAEYFTIRSADLIADQYGGIVAIGNGPFFFISSPDWLMMSFR